MSEILAKNVASVLNLDADEFISTLKVGDEFLPEEKIAKIIVAKFSEASTAATRDAVETARRKGQSEETKRLKQLVKKAGFENPDNLIGEELFEAFVSWKDENAPTGNGLKLDELGKDELVKLPVVKSLIEERIQTGALKYEALKKDLDTKLTEFEQFKQSVEQGKIQSVVKARVEQAVKKGNVILQVEGLDIDPNERVTAVFERLWSREKFGLDQHGNPVILDAEGYPKTDPAFGGPISFDDAVLGVAKPMFGTSTQNPTHQGSGIPQNRPGQPAAWTPTMRLFANQQEKDNYVMNEPDPAKRLEASRTWQYQQEKAAGN